MVNFQCVPLCENCHSCQRDVKTDVYLCNICKEGYYAKNGVCQKCSSTCKNSACERTTAQCLEGCIDGWTGLLCNIPEDGTKLPVTACEGSCLTCNADTRQCSSCIAGMWGKSCEQKCPSHCSVCDQQTGQCMVVCSKYCQKSVNMVSCNNVTGACLQGCQDGWYGDQCQNMCAQNCIDKECDRTTGHCTKGCSPGWKGFTCSEANKMPAVPSVAMIAVAVVAAIVVVAIIISTFVFCRFRKKRLDEKEHSYTNVTYSSNAPSQYTNNGFMLDSVM